MMLTGPTKALIEAATLAARPEYRSDLLALLHSIKESERATFEELYEVFLQTYLFVGFPAALESVRSLERVFGRSVESESNSNDEIIDEYRQSIERGEVLYKKVYAANADRVRSEMLRLSPELAAWAMIEGYGKTLSRDRLDTKTRELCIVAQLTQLGWERQLFSHLLGAKNVGASVDEIREAIIIGARGDAKSLEQAEQLVRKIV
jgi:4-carboxymuconolactone decarboxylase